MTELKVLTDEEFLAAFLSCSLPASHFNHLGHLRVAWLMLQRYPLADAIEHTCAGIARYAASLGASTKYHRTLTEALIRLMAHGGAADSSIDWNRFAVLNRHLIEDARSVLDRYYSPERLSLLEAQSMFISPDRLPLPT